MFYYSSATPDTPHNYNVSTIDLLIDCYDKTWFCQERHQKQAIALEQNVRVFIDDRYSVLKHLTLLDRLYLFCPSATERAAFEAEAQKEKFIIVNGWAEVLDTILSIKS